MYILLGYKMIDAHPSHFNDKYQPVMKLRRDLDQVNTIIETNNAGSQYPSNNRQTVR